MADFGGKQKCRSFENHKKKSFPRYEARLYVKKPKPTNKLNQRNFQMEGFSKFWISLNFSTSVHPVEGRGMDWEERNAPIDRIFSVKKSHAGRTTRGRCGRTQPLRCVLLGMKNAGGNRFHCDSNKTQYILSGEKKGRSVLTKER